MGYLTVKSKKGTATLIFASELWIFAVLTVILLLLTFCGWLCLDLPKEKRWWRTQAHRTQTVDQKV